jgi:hypothetical protein
MVEQRDRLLKKLTAVLRLTYLSERHDNRAQYMHDDHLTSEKRYNDMVSVLREREDPRATPEEVLENVATRNEEIGAERVDTVNAQRHKDQLVSWLHHNREDLRKSEAAYISSRQRAIYAALSLKKDGHHGDKNHGRGKNGAKVVDYNPSHDKPAPFMAQIGVQLSEIVEPTARINAAITYLSRLMTDSRTLGMLKDSVVEDLEGTDKDLWDEWVKRVLQMKGVDDNMLQGGYPNPLIDGESLAKYAEDQFTAWRKMKTDGKTSCDWRECWVHICNNIRRKSPTLHGKLEGRWTEQENPEADADAEEDAKPASAIFRRMFLIRKVFGDTCADGTSPNGNHYASTRARRR